MTLYQGDEKRIVCGIALTVLLALPLLFILKPKKEKMYGVALVEVDGTKKIVPLRIALRMVNAGTGKILLTASNVSELQVKALRRGLI